MSLLVETGQEIEIRVYSRPMPGALTLFYVFNFFAFSLAAVPLEYFFFRSRGMDFQQFSWLMTVYYAVMVACDVPAGVLADRFGRKFCLVLGPLGFGAGFVIRALGNSFEVYALGEAVTAFGHAFISGAISSFLYDTLKERGEEGRFLRLESAATAMRLLGTSFAFLLGGIVGKYVSIEATNWLTAAMTGSAGLLALFLKEPKVHDRTHLSMRAIFLDSMRSIVADRAVRWITVYFALLFVWLRLAFQTYQVKLDQIGVQDPLHIGVVYFLLNVLAAAISRSAPALRQHLGEGVIFLGMQACVLVSFAILGLSSASWIYVMFFAQQLAFGLHFPIISNFANQKIPSEKRTTILSFQSMIGRLAFSLFFPLFGWWETRMGLSNAFLLSAGIGTLGMIWLSWRRPSSS